METRSKSMELLKRKERKKEFEDEFEMMKMKFK